MTDPRRTRWLLSTLALGACAQPMPTPTDARSDAGASDVADSGSQGDAAMDARADATAADTGVDTGADTGVALDAQPEASADVVDSGTRCPAGTSNCSGTCVDLQADPANCGACGTTCPSGQSCISGTCACPLGRSACGTPEMCVDLQADTNHCGACGTVCPSGQLCVMGACRIDCPAPRTRCGSGTMMTCVDTTTDVTNCGACGTSCALSNASASCAAGACAVSSCNAGFGNCDGNAANGCELNVRIDPMNCGACNARCMIANGVAGCAAGSCTVASCNAGFANCDGSAANGCETNTTTTVSSCGACGTVCSIANGTPACAAGLCQVATCNAGFANCDGSASNGCETNTNTSASNCGVCGRVCSAGQSCVSGACVTAGPTGTSYQIASLPASGCALIEHVGTTGDDRGGIAISSSRVFYNGDAATGRFSNVDLSGAASVGVGYDLLFNDLTTLAPYAFGTVSGPWRGTFTSAPFTIDRFYTLDPNTGAVTGSPIMLSAPLPMIDSLGSSTQGVFSGAGRVVVVSNGRAYDVALPSGVVTDRGAFTLPSHTGCENIAVWGVAELFGGTLYVSMVTSPTTISRVSVAPTPGVVSTIATFTNLSDMCSFTVNPSNGRWYWHHEGVSQFGGSDESVGYCGSTPRTCRDHYAGGARTDGLYTVDSDGPGPLAPFQVYCDMTLDGGGWTLVGRMGDPRLLPNLDATVGAITAPGGSGNILHSSYASITGTAVRVGRFVASGTNTGNLFQINDCTAGDAACWYGSFINQNDGDMYGAWLSNGGAWRSVPAGCTTDQCPTSGGERDQPGATRIAIFGGDCHFTCNTNGDLTRNGFVYRDYGSAMAPSRIGNRAYWSAGTSAVGATTLGTEIANADYGQSGTQYRDLWIR